MSYVNPYQHNTDSTVINFIHVCTQLVICVNENLLIMSCKPHNADAKYLTGTQ